ncbi:hypothetical protein [Nocardia wallacei]|uniref:hypothetical protein n=1 Tax=Nocardia wallacei TaxID=480035 RepID=UPI0024569F6A|nr:hypothetical protein [Nocardia wallacei]
MSGSRLSAAGGWLAEWRLHRDRIRIALVRSETDAEPVFASSLTLAPDLVQMRELFPDLGPLWDAIHDDFWQAYRPGGDSDGRSPSRIHSDTMESPTGNLRVVSRLPSRSRIPHLSLRARKGGYRLVREPLPPYLWTLRDADDGERIHSARTLDEIEQWLDT